MSVNEKMTNIANAIRNISNTTEAMGLDSMASNLNTANSDLQTQENLMSLIAAALENKIALPGNSVETASVLFQQYPSSNCFYFKCHYLALENDTISYKIVDTPAELNNVVKYSFIYLTELYATSTVNFFQATSTDFTTIFNNQYGSMEVGLFVVSQSNGTIYLDGEECCFIPGTQILTSLEGDTTPIEQLTEGDTIVAYNIDTKENYLAKVNSLIINNNSTDIAEIYCENGEKLIMTAYHPIYTINNEFHSLTNYHNYPTLQIGDMVKTYQGETSIIDIKHYTSEPIFTYNIDVIDFDEVTDNETNDTFYANGIVVHNAAAPCK